MKTRLLIWSLVIGHCLAGPGFFMNQQGAVANSAAAYTGFTPSDYGSIAVKYWISANRELFQGYYSDGNAVGTIRDFSTSAVNATQATESKKPTFRTNRVNGLPAFVVDGVDDAMDLPSNPLSAASAVTVMFVAKSLNSGTTSGAVFDKWGLEGSGFNSHYVYAPNNTWYDSSFTTSRKTVSASYAFAVRSWSYVTIISASGKFTVRFNGSEIFTTASNTFSAGGTSPKLFYGTSVWLNGEVAEMVIWNGELTGSDLTGAENGLKTQYGL